MKNSYILLLLITGISFFYNCGDDGFSVSDPDKAVIQGYLFPGHTAEITINRQQILASEDTTMDLPLSGLSVTLSNQTTGKSEVLKDNGAGSYSSEMIIEDEGSYKIEFDYNNNHVWATTSIPTKVSGFKTDATELLHTERFSDDTVRYVNYYWDNEEESYHLFYIYNMESWTTPIYNFTPSKSITTTPTADTAYQVNSRGFYYYGRHYMILYKVTDEYVDLYYSSNGNSQHMTNPPTNVNNGFGIFTAMSSDTLVLTLR
ncbi:MAG: hypothetical protein Q4F97_06045 [Bacteroidales bacterium]|nr:hypothetical protein [Bacteroidales bacterium]